VKVSVRMENPDELTVFLFLIKASVIACMLLIYSLAYLISIGFSSRWSHVVASQLKNRLRQYGSI